MEVFLKYWYFGFHFLEPIYKVKLFVIKFAINFFNKNNLSKSKDEAETWY